ncbi:MAG TPA: hypothetical protein VK814_15915 [Acidobacteriaceae bacterium]|nr:hypothetical protein [Acidobacteriaceae bacterium]
MTATRAATHTVSAVLRRACSFPVLLAVLLSVLGALTVRSRFNDPDMWWHLKTGQIIWTTHRIPTTDIFSFTTSHHAYVPQEWLSQILIYATYRLGGYSGLMAWLCLSTVAVLVAGYLLCTLYSGNAKVAFLGAVVIWLFATTGLSLRPQMIGYLLLIVELLLMQLGRTRSPRWFWGLPPLFALWVNCHASFFLGFGVASLFFLSSFFDFRTGSLVALPWEPYRRKLLGLALLLSVAALFLNPIGVRQILYPLDTLIHQPIGLSHSEEWLPLQMNGGRGLGLLVVAGGILLLVIVQRSELFWDELVMLALGTWLAVSHQRMVFVFGILAAPVISRLLADSWDGYDAAHDRPVPNAILIALSLLVIVWGFPNRQNLASQVDQGNPTQAVQFIQTNHLAGNMLNDYGYGGYLIWAAPDHPVFIDGRSDVFESTGVLAQYGRWALLQSDPNSLLNQYNISFCLLARTAPMAHVLPFLPNWKAVYSDNRSIIFMRTPSTSLSPQSWLRWHKSVRARSRQLDPDTT